MLQYSTYLQCPNATTIPSKSLGSSAKDRQLAAPQPDFHFLRKRFRALLPDTSGASREAAVGSHREQTLPPNKHYKLPGFPNASQIQQSPWQMTALPDGHTYTSAPTDSRSLL